jgi:hypothetical protein
MKVYGNRYHSEDKMLGALDRKRSYNKTSPANGLVTKSEKTLVWLSKELIDRLHPVKA